MPAIPLNALRTFEAVASRLSFSKGAQVLNVTPAAVSSQIRSLEEQLNHKLFHRKGRHITLTDAGQKLLPGVQRGLQEMTRAVRSLEEDKAEGVLNVSVMPSFMQRWLAHRLADFYKDHGEIDLRINASNAVVDFDNSDFHAAVRFGPGRWAGLRAVRMLDDWIVPVCSPELAKEIGPMKSARDLTQHNLLIYDDEMWNKWFEALGGTVIKRNWPKVDDSISVLIAAEQGHGIALARWSVVARDLDAGRLVRPIPTAVKTDWSYYFVSPPHYFDLPKVTTLREWLFENAREFDRPE